jgi:membrane fusion protein (multidrug efflux system)
MLVRVGISRGQRQSPSAPESAIAVQGDSAFAYVIHQQGQRAMAEQRPIVTGLRQQGFVEIRDGLRPGDRIVADGLNKMQPGQPVRVGGAPPKAAAAGAPERPLKTSWTPSVSGGARATAAQPSA